MSTTTMKLSTYEVCDWIRRSLLRRAGEVIAYQTWSPEFAAQQMREAPDEMRQVEGFRPVNPSDLTNTQMDALGFGRWSEDDPMRLIPLWLLPFLTDDLDAVSIGGERVTRREEMDNDNRFGMLAYGVIPATQEGDAER